MGKTISFTSSLCSLPILLLPVIGFDKEMVGLAHVEMDFPSLVWLCPLQSGPTLCDPMDCKRQGVQHLLRAVNMEPDQYQMGSTKVFVKNPESVSVWERQTDTSITCMVLFFRRLGGPGHVSSPPPSSLGFSIWKLQRVLVTLQDQRKN